MSQVSAPGKQRRLLKSVCVALGGALIASIVYLHPFGRETGVNLLGLCGPPAVPWLMSAFEDSDQHVRKAAYDNLRKMGSKAVPGLIVKLHDSHPTTRADAAAIVGLREVNMGKESEVSAELVQRLNDDDRAVQIAARNSLAWIGPAASIALPSLRLLLGHEDVEMRIGGMRAIVAIDRDSAETLSLVLQMLTDTDPAVRIDACSTLENMHAHDSRVVSALIDVLGDPVAEVRSAAADYLGEMGPAGKAAIPALQTVANEDPNPMVRSEARNSLENLNILVMP